MHCPVCKAVNSAGRLYCGRCAQALGAACPVCQFVNGHDERYCGGCALDLRAAPPVVAAAAAAVEMLDATEMIDAARPVAAAAPAPGGGPDFEDLDDLVVTAGMPEAGGNAAALTSQSDVDEFFRRLSQEGTVQIPGPAPGGTGGAKGGKP